MNQTVKKILRTLQVNFPGLEDHKYAVQRFYRNTLRIPHERDFNALDLFPAEPEAIYLDVGASRGQTIDAIRMRRPDCRIHAFEPHLLFAEKLARRYASDQSVVLHDFGLGDKAGNFTLFVPVYKGFMFDGLASFKQSEAREWLEHRVYWYREDNLEIREIDCEVRTLDSLGMSPFFIKLDIQGYEFKALQGAAETLSRATPILLIESADRRIQEYLEGFGYAKYSFVNNQLTTRPYRTVNSFFITKDKYDMLRVPAGHAAA